MYFLTGLKGCTKYEWRVRKKCKSGEYGPWSTVSSFTTNSKAVKVRAYIFNRFAGANFAGHDGVGYEIINTNSQGVETTRKFFFGGVENSQAQLNIASGAMNFGWYSSADTKQEMLNSMKFSYGYDTYKETTSLNSPDCQAVSESFNLLQNFSQRGYKLLGNNCMDAAYDVVTKFGFFSPNPSTFNSLFYTNPNPITLGMQALWTPNGWYFANVIGWSPVNNL